MELVKTSNFPSHLALAGLFQASVHSHTFFLRSLIGCSVIRPSMIPTRETRRRFETVEAFHPRTINSSVSDLPPEYATVDPRSKSLLHQGNCLKTAPSYGASQETPGGISMAENLFSGNAHVTESHKQHTIS